MDANTLIVPAHDAATGLFVLVFRTNIRYKKDVKAVAANLDQHPGVKQWNVDMDDADRILRIVATEYKPETFISMVKDAGFFCEELND